MEIMDEYGLMAYHYGHKYYEIMTTDLVNCGDSW